MIHKSTTIAPTTIAPTTIAPTTIAPTTIAPTTIVPTTIVPTTIVPTTIVPTTVAWELPSTVLSILQLQLTSEQLAQHLCGIHHPLLNWYDQNARILPWREQPTPYRVWVSEIMLQQTRVNAVLPYFERFTHTLPTVQDLADASEEVLLKLWEGLGYYNRVRNMQKAAQIIVSEYDGAFPASYEQLLTLPGIGEYTAGAVASIAYQIPVPAVDGNVLRILSRILMSPADIMQLSAKRAFQSAVQTMLPLQRVGDFNQALMELGATVCLPNSAPLCSSCPIHAQCIAFQHGNPLALPVKSPKKPRRVEQRTVLIAISNQKVLLTQRSEQRLLANMWEYINIEGHLTQQEIGAWFEQYNITPLQITPIASSQHLFTHIKWEMQGYAVALSDCSISSYIWADQQEVDNRYSIPSAFKVYTKQLPVLFRKI